jgi:carbon-monoxide dehydrogenase medium subunit
LGPDFHAPATVAEALRELEDRGAIAVGGGTQVGLLARHGLIRPSRLVWLGRLDELRGAVVEPDGSLVIGAGTTLAAIAAATTVRTSHPMLADAAARVGNPRVRAVATLGGHLVHADPRQDLPPVLLALGAVVRLRSSRAEREVPLRDFFLGPFETVVGEGELLTQVRVPPAARGRRSRYVRFTPASENDYPTVGVAACLELDGGDVRRAVVGLGGVGSRPLLLDLGELAGRPARPDAFEAAGEAAAAACDPSSDPRGSAAYKRAMARLWTARTLTALAPLPA